MKKLSAKQKNQITRRVFLSNTIAGTAVAFFYPLPELITGDNQQTVVKWPEDAGKFRFYLTGHAHIDPVWLWPWFEGVAVVHSTFRSALDWMKRNPEFCFTASSAQFYEWVAENDPKMLGEIRAKVAEGRWCIAGGWWVEPDVNIPCGEAMVRQGLYGQRTFQKLLGRKAKVAFNPDSFGHAGSLPQIFLLQGMENYIFMRPQPKEKTLPGNIFWWEGIDGTRILTYRIPISYNDTSPVQNRVSQILNLYRNEPVSSFLGFFGAGDHGGGVTKENIDSIEELKKEKGAPTVLFSTPERWFSEIRKLNSKFPVVKDDLQYHAVGCYTAESGIKKGNRQAETALITAEKICSIGSIIWGAVYPAKEFEQAWKRVLFLQFHDSLAGTSLFEHSQTAREGFGFATDIAEQAKYLALQKLEWQIPAKDPASQYFIAFNPHAWEVKTNVEYDLSWQEQKASAVEDENGNPLLFQWTAGSSEAGSRRKLIVNTSLPPLGYRQIRVKQATAPTFSTMVKAESNILENEYFRITFSESGTISLFDKENGIELFERGIGCRAVVIDDPSDTWSHDIKTFNNETGSFGNATIKVLETGPLRGKTRVTSTWGSSTLIIDWSLSAGSRKIEANVTLNWNERLKMLKLSFPVNVDKPIATTEIPYGAIERQKDGMEVPGQRWIDITGMNKGSLYGLTVFNDAKYGYSFNGSDMRISVVRSAVYAHHDPKKLDPQREYLWMDQGIQTFRILLMPHKGKWQENDIPRIAEEFSTPPLVIYQGIHDGKMPGSGSFITADSPGLVISAIKKSEEGNDIVLRVVETLGLPVLGGISLKFSGMGWIGSFRPYEIKTLLINVKAGTIREVNLLEE